MKNFSQIKGLIREEFLKRRRQEDNGTMTVGWPVYDENEIFAALDALLSLKLSQGSNVRAFENEYCNYLGLPEESGVAVNSGSSANLIAFATLIEAEKLKKGDEVIVPAATFATVSSPLYQLGLIPVYVDIEMDTWNLDPEEILKAISEKTKAIMVVHNLGFPAKMDEINQIASKNDLLVLEDCCEAHGAFYKGEPVGSLSYMSMLSFFVAHNITTGEGGMVFFKDDSLRDKIRSIREFGRKVNFKDRYQNYQDLGDYDNRYVFELLGYNLRMTDFVAAMGRVQLTKLDKLNETRKENAKFFSKIVLKFSEHLQNLNPMEGSDPAYYGFPILVKSDSIKRNKLCIELEKRGIETRPNMGGCLPDQPGFKAKASKHRISGDLKNSRDIRDNAFFIGVHSGLTNSQLDNFEGVLKESITGSLL